MAEKVLVLGGSTRIFLTIVRSLGRKGLEVHVANPSFSDAVLRSRYIDKVHYLPTQDRPEEWKDSMVKLLAAEKYSLVIPNNDPEIILCRRYRAELEPLGRVYLLNDRADEVVNDKMRTYELARSLGVNVPRSKLVEREADMAGLDREFTFPLMLKPVSSFHDQDLLNKRFVKRVDAAEDLEPRAREMLKDGPLMVQEFFEGTGAGVEVLAHHGRILTSFQHVRVHEQGGGGVSTYRKSVAVDPELLEASRKILAALDYHGVGMLEFKIGPARRRWTLIEINGRFWGSLPLPVAAGMDFPYYLYEMLVHGRTDFPTGYKVNIYSRNTTMDLKWMRENLMGHKGEVLRESKNLLLLRERNDTLVLDDPNPGIAEIAEIAGGPARAAKGVMDMKLRARPFMRRRTARRLRDQLAGAKSVMFVCMGNICRSPFAEHYARKVMPGVLVSSSGTYEKQDRRTPDDGVTASRAHGLDLTAHRSRTVTEEMVDEADVILVFDRNNMREMWDRFPKQKDKVFFISEVDPTAPLVTEDPYGKDLEAYESAYRRIADYLDRMDPSRRS